MNCFQNFVLVNKGLNSKKEFKSFFTFPIVQTVFIKNKIKQFVQTRCKFIFLNSRYIIEIVKGLNKKIC